MTTEENEKLAAITKAFEARFAEVVDYDPEQPDPRRTPRHNLPYLVFHNGLVKKEAELSPGGDESDIDDALASFATRMLAMDVRPAKTLFWRVKPEINEHGKGQNYRCRIYCRMMWV